MSNNTEKNNITLGGKKFYRNLTKDGKGYKDKDNTLRIANNNYIPNLEIAIDYKSIDIYDEIKKETVTKIIKYFASFEHCAELYLWQEKTKINTCYEIIPDSKQKPHFDIDISYKKDVTPSVEHKSLLNKIIANIHEVLLSYNVKLVKNDILIYNSSIEGKYSFHIVIDNYVHKNSKEARAFYDLVIDNLTEKEQSVIDNSVYKSTQLFRIFNNRKINKNNVKVLAYPLPWVVPEDDNFPSDLPFEYTHLHHSLVSWWRGCKDLPDFINVNKSNKPKISEIKDFIYDEQDFIYLFEDSIINSIYDIATIEYNLITLKIKSNNDIKCPICERAHQNENGFIVIKNNGKVYFDCRRRASNQSLYFMGQLDEQLDWDNLDIDDQDENIEKYTDFLNKCELYFKKTLDKDNINNISHNNLQLLIPNFISDSYNKFNIPNIIKDINGTPLTILSSHIDSLS